MGKLASFARLLKMARRANGESGRAVSRQVSEVLELRKAPNLVRPDEYFAWRLFEKSPEEQRTFLGTANDGIINYMVSSPLWMGVARDKLLFHNLFASLGYRVPRIQLLYTPTGRTCAGATIARDEASLVEALRELTCPVFAKPLGGDVGLGAYFIHSVDKGGDSVTLVSGETLPLPAFAKRIMETGLGGYVFQDVLENGLELREMLGREITSIRLCIAREKGSYKTLRAFLKVRVAGNVTDNWDYGRYGNGLAMLDEESGKINDVLTGTYPDVRHGTTHPGTGEVLVGKILPRYAEIRNYAEKAATEYPGLVIQHWDMVLTGDGPTLLEVNEDGSLHALQGMGSRGMLDGRLQAILAEYGHDVRSARTQEFMRGASRLMNQAYAMDNALMGRGTFYQPVNRL